MPFPKDLRERESECVRVLFSSSFFDFRRWSVKSLFVNRQIDYYPLVNLFLSTLWLKCPHVKSPLMLFCKFSAKEA